MVKEKKFHTGETPIFIDGRLVPPGTFYDAPEVEFIAVNEEVSQAPVEVKVPKYEEVTMPAMKAWLDEREIDYSEHEKDKTTLYAFFVSEMNKHEATD